MPTSPPFSYVTYTITTPMIATPEFSYATIGLLEDATVPIETQLEVYLNGVLLTLTTDYTFISGNKIDVSATLQLGDFLKIQRNTEKGTRYVDFTNNSILNESDLDLSANQIFFIAQEAYDLAYNTVRLTSAGDAWEGQGLEATNFAPAASGSSLVTLNQVNGLILGLETATIDGCRIYGFEGDGATTDFALDAGVPTNISACQLLVMVDGVVYEADCDSGNPPVGSGI